MRREEALQEMRAAYDARRKFIVQGLNDIGLETFEPHGAFYAFPSVAVTGMDGVEFSRRLLEEEKVAVVPGSAFGTGGENFVRCSYAASMENIEKALDRMARFVERHRA
jgi:aminotransferase